MVQEFVQQIKDTVDECLYEVHTAMPAKIVSIDTSSGLATVLPTIKRMTADGSTMDFPQISGVPIVLQQGSGQTVSIAIPVKAGDSCLLIISEESLEYWLYGRETDTSLMFDITNAICIPGLFQKPPDSFLDACDSDSIIIDAGETRLAVNTAGIAVLGSLTVNGNLNVTGDMSVSGSAVNGSLNVIGDMSVSGSEKVAGSHTVGGDQKVTGSTTIGGSATITGNLTASGTVSLG